MLSLTFLSFKLNNTMNTTGTSPGVNYLYILNAIKVFLVNVEFLLLVTIN